MGRWIHRDKWVPLTALTSLLADLGDGMENGLGSPFRKWTLSTAAQTHRLRRLRGPAKCRECEAFMVSGTECEEVWPALET